MGGESDAGFNTEFVGFHQDPVSPSLALQGITSLQNSQARIDWVEREVAFRRDEFRDKKKVKIKVVTWNVEGARVAEDLTNLLEEAETVDVYVVGYGRYFDL
jgi:hypothetical protein